MNTPTNLLKDHQIGTWCKRAAWIILAIGLLEIALNIYNISRQFGYGSPPFTSSLLVQIVGYGVVVLPSILFYFFILYAIGSIVNHFITASEDDEYDENDYEDEVEEGEETTSGQIR